MGARAFDLIQSEMERVAEAQARHAELERSMRRFCDEFTELAGKAGIRMTFTVATRPELLAKDVGVKINITKGFMPFRKHASVKIRYTDDAENSPYYYRCQTNTGGTYGPRMDNGLRSQSANFEDRKNELNNNFKEFILVGFLTKAEGEKIQAQTLKP